MTRTCYLCKEEKPITEFHKNKYATGGYAYECKECKNARCKVTNAARRAKEFRNCSICNRNLPKTAFKHKARRCNECISKIAADREKLKLEKKNRYLEDFIAANYKDGKKKCSICGEYKDLTEYWKRDKGIDGHFGYCKACRRPSDRTSYAKIYSRLKASAQRRGLEFSIDRKALIEWVKDPANNICAHCGISQDEYAAIIEKADKVPALKKYLSGSHGSTNLTFDRKDSDNPYTLDNLQKACWFCNSVKNCLFDDEDMKKLGPIVRNRVEKLVS